MAALNRRIMRLDLGMVPAGRANDLIRDELVIKADLVVVPASEV